MQFWTHTDAPWVICDAYRHIYSSNFQHLNAGELNLSAQIFLSPARPPYNMPDNIRKLVKILYYLQCTIDACNDQQLSAHTHKHKTTLIINGNQTHLISCFSLQLTISFKQRMLWQRRSLGVSGFVLVLNARRNPLRLNWMELATDKMVIKFNY